MSQALSLAVVTASDAAFYPHLQNLLHSLARQQARPDRVLVIDAGLSGDQRDALHASGHTLVSPRDWLPGTQDPMLMSTAIRPQLDRVAPDVDLILWLDADMWLQSPTYVAEMHEFSRDYELLAVPQLDASYRNGRIGHRIRPVVFGLARLSGWNFDRMAKGYGHAVACRAGTGASINAGMFLARRQSTFWEEWRRRYDASRFRGFGLDQVSLTLTFREAPLVCAALDASYNWVCQIAPPVFDAGADFFRKPNPPYHPIGAIHMTSTTKNTPLAIRRLGGGEAEVALYDPAVVAEAIRACSARTSGMG